MGALGLAGDVDGIEMRREGCGGGDEDGVGEVSIVKLCPAATMGLDAEQELAVLGQLDAQGDGLAVAVYGELEERSGVLDAQVNVEVWEGEHPPRGLWLGAVCVLGGRGEDRVRREVLAVDGEVRGVVLRRGAVVVDDESRAFGEVIEAGNSHLGCEVRVGKPRVVAVLLVLYDVLGEERIALTRQHTIIAPYRRTSSLRA